MSKPRLLIVVNVDWFFLSHRMPIAVAALQAGYDVHLACGLTDRSQELARAGLSVHALPLARSGTRVLQELRTFLALRRIIIQVQPDVLHLVTIKPVLFGGIIARLLHRVRVVAAIPGLGTAFMQKGLQARVLQRLLFAAYRIAFANPRLVAVFQNADDERLLAQATTLRPAQCVRIRGSGVDLQAFVPTPLPEAPMVVMVGRLLRDKGVNEFVEAARQLRAAGVQARFCLVGEPDAGNRSSVGDDQLEVWRQSGDVELWGFRADMPQVLQQAWIVVLPSYREGLPKVLLEAAASGRAVVTTDVPGCRDAIDPDVTGLLVPAREPQALARAIRQLLDDPALCLRLGQAGRVLAEREFSITSVVQAHLEIYARLLGTSP